MLPCDGSNDIGNVITKQYRRSTNVFMIFISTHNTFSQTNRYAKQQLKNIARHPQNREQFLEIWIGGDGIAFLFSLTIIEVAFSAALRVITPRRLGRPSPAGSFFYGTRRAASDCWLVQGQLVWTRRRTKGKLQRKTTCIVWKDSYNNSCLWQSTPCQSTITPRRLGRPSPAGSSFYDRLVWPREGIANLVCA